MNKRNVCRTFLAVTAVMAAGPTLSDSLDLNFNKDAARLTFARLISDDKLEVDVGWLHHQDRGNLISVSLGRFGDAGGGDQAVAAALGGRLYAIDANVPGPPIPIPPIPSATSPVTGPPAVFSSQSIAGPSSSENGFALGVGGLFRLKLTGYDRIGFSGHGYYAPDVITFGDVDDFIEVAGRVTYSVLREGDVYLGVRYIKADVKGHDAKFDTGLHVGIRLEF